MDEQVIFAATFNGLYRAFGSTLDARAAYPLSVFLDVLKDPAASLGTEGTEDDRVFLVGRRLLSANNR